MAKIEERIYVENFDEIANKHKNNYSPEDLASMTENHLDYSIAEFGNAVVVSFAHNNDGQICIQTFTFDNWEK